MAEETTIEEPLVDRIYYMAKDGMSMAMYSLLTEQTAEVVDSIINQKTTDDDGQHCTPLIIAARYGRQRVVKMLLEKFKPDIESEGTVKFNGYVIEGASALWCAAGAGHLGIVRTLVKAGANINHATKTNSTPLRAACFDGRLDVVTYLIEHDANIRIANIYNNTCLMIASYKGYFDVVRFLLENNADPNQKALCGATALHFAAECGHRNIVIELLKRGAVITENISGMTPIMTAAERTRGEVVDTFIARKVVSKEETIRAYELLGASYANDKDNYCISSAYEYLYKAMELRFEDPEDVIQKNVVAEPLRAYENWRECETLEMLSRIRNDHNAIHMEGLVIRERILGTHNPEVPPSIIYRGAVFADQGRFDRCIDLWLHALKLRQLNNISVSKDLLRFAQVFSQMIHVGVDLEFLQVLDVLEASVIELSRNKAKIKDPDPKDDLEQCIEESESNITTTLYILTILTKLMALNEKDDESEDVQKARFLVHKLCALRMSLADGQTLLHLAVNARTPVDDFHTNDVCKFPCAATVKLLIQCGADVNAMDNERNTPLHLIVTYQKPISDFTTLHTIIMELIEAGTHVDIVNSKGQTPYEAATTGQYSPYVKDAQLLTGVAEIILRAQTKISLKCIAAKAVKIYGLSYTGNVPQTLESFIELHGP